MNTIYRLTILFSLTLSALGADVKFSALPTATSPSTNSYLPIIDLNLLPAAQNQKYLLTNLATVASLSGYATVPTQISLTHAGTVTLTNTTLQSWATLTLTGNVTFATSALAAGHGYTVYGRNTQATNCTPTFPSWRFMGGAPATITAGKEFTLSLFSTGTVDTNVWAAYAEAQ